MTLIEIPSDILKLIMKKLEVKDLPNVFATCSFLSKHLDIELVWQDQLEAIFTGTRNSMSAKALVKSYYSMTQDPKAGPGFFLGVSQAHSDLKNLILNSNLKDKVAEKEIGEIQNNSSFICG